MVSDIIADSRATSLGIRIASINVKMATRLTNSQGIPRRLCRLMVVQVMGGRDCYDFVEGFIRVIQGRAVHYGKRSAQDRSCLLHVTWINIDPGV